MLGAIEPFWRDTLRLLLESSTAEGLPPTAYLRRVDDFVVNLDAFVKLLEQDTAATCWKGRFFKRFALWTRRAIPGWHDIDIAPVLDGFIGSALGRFVGHLDTALIVAPAIERPGVLRQPRQPAAHPSGHVPRRRIPVQH
jgi:hypothetical protein